MSIITVVAFIILVLGFMTFGILSLTKPELIGAELQWIKYNWMYIPKYKKSTNKYYNKQIKMVGIGLIVASIVMIVFLVGYVSDPDILLWAKYINIVF